MNEPKIYTLDVHQSGECDVTARAVTFSIDEETAREIVKLSKLVQEHRLAHVVKYDYHADFLQYDPIRYAELADRADKGGEENSIHTEANCLNVSETVFWFSAFIKHTDVELSSDMRSVSELIKWFN